MKRVYFTILTIGGPSSFLLDEGEAEAMAISLTEAMEKKAVFFDITGQGKKLHAKLKMAGVVGWRIYPKEESASEKLIKLQERVVETIEKQTQGGEEWKDQ